MTERNFPNTRKTTVRDLYEMPEFKIGVRDGNSGSPWSFHGITTARGSLAYERGRHFSAACRGKTFRTKEEGISAFRRCFAARMIL